MARKQSSGGRWWPWVGGAFVGAALTAIWFLSRPPAADEWPAVRFDDITERSGVDFTHHNAASKWKYLPETMGSGVAILDYDGDGHNDLLFINGRPWPGAPGPVPTMKLYRNKGGGVFSETTKEARLDVPLQGMGVAVGDFDNDGRPDLFITAVGGNRLFRNVDGKRFEDVTALAGVAGPGGWPSLPEGFSAHARPLNWSASAAWLDYDGDGRLDLFVTNYVVWSPKLDIDAGSRLATGERAYGPPRAFDGTQCFLYRNIDGRRFEDVSKLVAVTQRGAAVGKSLGVAVGDFAGDGRPCIAVANDTERNFLFRNLAGRSFEEVGMTAGVAYADRHARGAMGIDWQPAYRPGRDALLLGNFADEANTLLSAKPASLRFADLAVSEGIAAASRPLLKFGLMWLDFDLDGRADFVTCNGHLEPDIARADPTQRHAQPVQLFYQRDNGFALAPESAVGPALLRPLVGRGCAYGDLDGDGIPDLVLTANGGPARVLRCVNKTGNNFVRLRLRGTRCNAMALGARVIVEAGGREQRREVQTTRGYLSCSEAVLTFGIGPATKADKVTIHWPGSVGPPQVLHDVPAGRTVDIAQASGGA